MGSIILAMPRAEDANKMAEVIKRSGLMMEIEICSKGSEILRITNDRDCGVVICMQRVTDMNYTELFEYLPPEFGMIVLTRDVSMETYSNRCVKLLVPFRASDIIATVEMLLPGYGSVRRRKNKGVKQRSPEERQIIDNAKAILIERNGMTEPEAFRYLQKNSMDYSRSLVESAQMILAMNE